MTTSALPEHSELVIVIATPEQKDVIIQREQRLWSRGKDLEVCWSLQDLADTWRHTGKKLPRSMLVHGQSITSSSNGER